MDDVFIELFDPADPPDLGPGPRNGRLSVAEVDAGLKRAFAVTAPGTDGREAIRALALLWHDHHDAAHSLVQDASGGVGAYIHGMLHRREPDFWNAKYWFRRVLGLPFLAPLGAKVALIGGADSLAPNGVFDASRFVDAVEAGTLDSETLKRVQVAEFHAVVAHLSR